MATTLADATITKTATANAGNNIFDITFSLPANKVKNAPIVIDVVILLDRSTFDGSSGAYLQIAAQQFVQNLYDAADASNGNVTFKVGLLWFDATVHPYEENSVAGLFELSSTNLIDMKSFLKSNTGAGTNLHGAIAMGKTWLDSDTTVPGDNKFMIIFSDFAGYFTDDGSGNGLGRYAIKVAGIIPDTSAAGIPTYESNLEYVYKETVLNHYPSLADLQNNSYVYTVDMIDKLINGVALLDIDATTPDLNYLINIGSTYGEYPYSTYYSGSTVTTGTPALIDFTGAEIATMLTQSEYRAKDMPTMFEKSIYFTGNLFKEMVDSDYIITAITTKYRWDIGNSVHTNVLGYQNMAYQMWFETYIGDRYDVTNGLTQIQATNIFDQVEAEIYYIIGKATITDIIAPEFEYIDGSAVVKVAGTELPVTKISQYIYGFGLLIAVNEYEYMFEYNPTLKTVLWDINVPVSRDNPLDLIFKVRFIGDPCETSSLVLPTNTSAVMDYMDSYDATVLRLTAYNEHLNIPSPLVTISSNGASCRMVTAPKTGVDKTVVPWLMVLCFLVGVCLKEYFNMKEDVGF